MTRFGRALEHADNCFGVGANFPDVLALGRWVNPVIGALGALILSSFLFTAAPATLDETPPPPAVQIAPSMPASTQLPAAGDAAIFSYSSPDLESPRTSTTDLLGAMLGALLALAGLMIVAWLGVRYARALTPGDETAFGKTAATDLMARNVCVLPHGPTCERMYDETRLVPSYLRCAAFPATRSDLLQLAEVHPDEGRALHRLERVTDRRYTSLHDLIIEIHVD